VLPVRLLMADRRNNHNIFDEHEEKTIFVIRYLYHFFLCNNKYFKEKNR